MKAKRVIFLLFVLFSIAGCGIGRKMQKEDESSTSGDLSVLRVSVQPYFLSAQLRYILDRNWDRENGLKLELVYADSGSEQVADDSLGKWDVATIGGAFIYPVADGKAVVIAEHISAARSNNIYARKDEAVFRVRGYNPVFQNVYGDPDTVKGKDIFMMPNTTSEYIGTKWLSSIGVRQDSVNIISGDFNENYERLKEGAGNFAALTAPYSLMAEEAGLKVVASATDLKFPFYEVIIANRASYDSKKSDIEKFLTLVLKANIALENNEELKEENAIAWYRSSSPNVVDDSYSRYIRKECRLKPYVTPANYDVNTFGTFERQYAEFLANTGNIKAGDLETVTNSIDSDIFKKALKNVQEEKNEK